MKTIRIIGYIGNNGKSDGNYYKRFGGVRVGCYESIGFSVSSLGFMSFGVRAQLFVNERGQKGGDSHCVFLLTFIHRVPKYSN